MAVDLVRKQFAFAIFFKRLFAQPDTGWVLLGGNALIIRIGGGRFTKDIDLARQEDWEDPEELLDDLRSLIAANDVADDFEVHLLRVIPHSSPDDYGYGQKTAKISARLDFGGREFESFSIDISRRGSIEYGISHHPIESIIPDPVIQELPPAPLANLERHIADKICAMYETHGSKASPSTRYRDLADLVRIIRDLYFETNGLAAALEAEQQRRKMRIPDKLQSPLIDWVSRFAKAAPTFADFPERFHGLEASLSYAGHCLNPVLAGSLNDLAWDPIKQVWD